MCCIKVACYHHQHQYHHLLHHSVYCYWMVNGLQLFLIVGLQYICQNCQILLATCQQTNFCFTKYTLFTYDILTKHFQLWIFFSHIFFLLFGFCLVCGDNIDDGGNNNKNIFILMEFCYVYHKCNLNVIAVHHPVIITRQVGRYYLLIQLCEQSVSNWF